MAEHTHRLPLQAALPGLGQLGACKSGSVGIVFALMFTTVASLAGLGLDYGRITAARSALSDAADGAALAVGRATMDGKLSPADVLAIGEAYFSQDTQDLARQLKATITPSISLGHQTVTVTASIDLPMTLMQIAGFKTVTIPVTSNVAFDAKDLEVAMALDITGSMNDVPPGGGPRKIDGLKVAFESFAETLLPDQPMLARKARIGVMPFSASVNLGHYAPAASLNASKDGCVTERPNKSYSDATPTIGGAFDVAADGVKNIDPTEGGVGDIRYFCPTQTVMPLTDNKAALVTQVSKFQPGGYTAGHLGVQWGWNLISENYASFWGGNAAPGPYVATKGENAKLVKAVILMTDGIFNTAYRNDISRNQALAMCTEMKKQGVLVFTIGFGLGNSGSEIAAKQTLAACATQGGPYFADASNTTQLDAALQRFATMLTPLRITH